MTRLGLTREQILRFRRRVGALDARLPAGPLSGAHAARAGLQDSMPRAALLSLHARVSATAPDALEDTAWVQIWGPRYSAYVVASGDHPIFTVGRMPDSPAKQRTFERMAARLDALLEGREMPADAAERALGEARNRLRYATLTGRLLIRWDGAHQPTVRVTSPPTLDPLDARLELARRHLRVFGPTTVDAFTRWAGVGAREARGAYQTLQPELTPVRTPAGDASILSEDEAAFREPAVPAASARLLPSGDAYYLLQGDDRALLVPDATRRAALWTSRVWPGAVMVDGDIVGIWRRAGAVLTVEPWQRLARAARDAVAAEAGSLPLPGLRDPIVVQWAD
ncbi:MAG: crosslink repair DNA glycosylase YcaQ family protein [Gemmatimonadota bacterium]